MNKNIIRLLNLVAVICLIIGVWLIMAGLTSYDGLQIMDIAAGGSLIIGAIIPAAFAQMLELLQRIANGVAPLPVNKLDN